jgi:hypothetical protein
VFSKFSLSLSITLRELPIVVAAILPIVSPLSVRSAFQIHSTIFVSVGEELFPIPVLETRHKLSFVGTRMVVMHSVSLLPSLEPLPLIVVSVRTLPSAKTVFFSLLPASFVLFPVVPLKFAPALPQSIDKFADVYPIICNLNSFVFLVLFKVALKYRVFCH